MSSKFSNGSGCKAWNRLWLIALAAFASAGLAQTAPDFRTVPGKEHYRKAVEYGDQGHWAAALLELNRGLAAEPGNPSILIELGIVHAERQEWQPALEALHRAAAAAPGSLRAHYNLGLTLDRADPGKGAGIPEYRRALHIEPAHVDSLLNLAIDLADRDPGESKALFQRTIQLAPRSAAAHMNYGLLLRRESEEGAAVAEFRQAIRLDPGLLEARRQLLAVLMSRRELAEAVGQCREILQREPGDAGTRYTLGQALIRIGKVEDGQKELAQAQTLRKAAQRHQQALEVQVQGVRDLDAGRFQQAAVAFRSAIQLYPSAERRMYLGLALAGSGDLAGALRELTSAVELEPRNARAHVNLAAVCLQAGREQQARAEVEKALQLDPWSPEAHNNLGLILAAGGHPEQAIEHFRLAADLNVRYLEAIFNLGLACRALRRLDEAAAAFRRAAGLAPESAQVRQALGLTLQDLGDPSGARAALKEAARLERRQK
ncbi:MAG TPA: tetratricopeptide repeat protein [Bryobacteraceae bacterium]|nr:tetratricopeptide repeat protein [Bryobacteraceae bacterium]